MKNIWKVVAVVGVLGVVVVAGGVVAVVAHAQTETPPFAGGFGPGMGRGMRFAGQVDGFGPRGGMQAADGGIYGPLHDEMLTALAKGLGVSVDELNARLANGDTAATIALEKGLSQEQFQSLWQQARQSALKAAVANGDLTQAQADWMAQRGARFNGNCPVWGRQPDAGLRRLRTERRSPAVAGARQRQAPGSGPIGTAGPGARLRPSNRAMNLLPRPSFKAVGVGQGILRADRTYHPHHLPVAFALGPAGESNAPMAQSILIVEDEPELAEILHGYLERAGFRVRTVHDGPAAVSIFHADPADLVLLDLNLPGMDGLDVARELRRHSSVPIVMVTARVEETDRLVGLELGADDYITKPYSPREVVARVRAVLRRSAAAPTVAPVLHAGEIDLDRVRHRVAVRGQEVELTPTEFSLLETLAGQPGRAFTRLQLLEATPGNAFAGYERTVDAHIKNLRAKIERDPRHPQRILTVFGVGYRFADE